MTVDEDHVLAVRYSDGTVKALRNRHTNRFLGLVDTNTLQVITPDDCEMHPLEADSLIIKSAETLPIVDCELNLDECVIVGGSNIYAYVVITVDGVRFISGTAFDDDAPGDVVPFSVDEFSRLIQ